MSRIEFPPINGPLLATALVAGAFATIGFDFFGQFISPLFKGIASPYLGAKLAPVALANQSLATILGVKVSAISGPGIGHAMHTLTGSCKLTQGNAMIYSKT